MKTTPKPRHWATLWCLLLALGLSAQDIHFSQFANSPLNLNPALTGAFEGDYRFQTNYRNQWNMPIPYNTISGSFEKNFCTVTCADSICWRPAGFSLGGLFNYDVAGDANLSLAQLELALSHTSALAPNFYFTAGLMVGGGQRSFDPVDLRFEAQFNGKEFDPGLSPNENFDNDTKFLFDLSSGFNFHYESCRKRHSLDFGTGIFHINRPNANFFTDMEVRLPTRWAFYGLSTWELAGSLDLIVNAMAHFQGPYQEILFGAGPRLHLQPGLLPGRLVLDVGLQYRLDDAVIPFFGFSYKMWQFGFSYDINTSGFRRATNRNGGPEFSLGYIIHRPQLPKKRICPVQL